MKRSNLLFLILSVILAACAPAETAPPAPTATAVPSTPAPAPTECAQELVLPAFQQVEPDPVIAGEPFKLRGSGGFFRDSCGGVNESAREFNVYLDDQPIGEIVCYVNHCEGDFVLPVETQAGTHCLSAKPGECNLEIQVTVR